MKKKLLDPTSWYKSKISEPEKPEQVKEVEGKKTYSVTEEISKSGYFWTVLHYASHYGHYDVLQFLIDFLDDHPDKFDLFNMQTFEGKTPLFCAILSGDIT